MLYKTQGIKSRVLFLIVCLLLTKYHFCIAQILNADSYGSKVDSVHHFKGLVDFNFKIRKQIDLILSFGTRADFSYYYKNSLFIVVGKFNLIKSANKNLLNSGFVHSRARFQQQNWIHPELFGQYQLDGVRGMEQRLLVGANLRIVLKKYTKGHLHLGIGCMYEYEHWNYSAVPVNTINNNNNNRPVRQHFLKLNVYLSYTQKIKNLAYWQIATYVQARPDSNIVYPRIAVNGMLSFKISKTIGFAIRYDVFYDALPPLPIDRLYYIVSNQLSISF